MLNDITFAQNPRAEHRGPTRGFCFRCDAMGSSKDPSLAHCSVFVNLLGDREVGLPQGANGFEVSEAHVVANGIDNLQVPIAVGPIRKRPPPPAPKKSMVRDLSAKSTVVAKKKQGNAAKEIVSVDVVVHTCLAEACRVVWSQGPTADMRDLPAARQKLVMRTVALAADWVQYESGLLLIKQSIKILQDTPYFSASSGAETPGTLGSATAGGSSNPAAKSAMDALKNVSGQNDHPGIPRGKEAEKMVADAMRDAEKFKEELKSMTPEQAQAAIEKMTKEAQSAASVLEQDGLLPGRDGSAQSKAGGDADGSSKTDDDEKTAELRRVLPQEFSIVNNSADAKTADVKTADAKSTPSSSSHIHTTDEQNLSSSSVKKMNFSASSAAAEKKTTSGGPLIQEVTPGSASTPPASSSSSQVTTTKKDPVMKKGFLCGGNAGSLYGDRPTAEGVLPDGAGDPLGYLPKGLRERCKVVDGSTPEGAAMMKQQAADQKAQEGLAASAASSSLKQSVPVAPHTTKPSAATATSTATAASSLLGDLQKMQFSSSATHDPKPSGESRPGQSSVAEGTAAGRSDPSSFEGAAEMAAKLFDSLTEDERTAMLSEGSTKDALQALLGGGSGGLSSNGIPADALEKAAAAAASTSSAASSAPSAAVAEAQAADRKPTSPAAHQDPTADIPDSAPTTSETAETSTAATPSAAAKPVVAAPVAAESAPTRSSSSSDRVDCPHGSVSVSLAGVDLTIAFVVPPSIEVSCAGSLAVEYPIAGLSDLDVEMSENGVMCHFAPEGEDEEDEAPIRELMLRVGGPISAIMEACDANGRSPLITEPGATLAEWGVVEKRPTEWRYVLDDAATKAKYVRKTRTLTISGVLNPV